MHIVIAQLWYEYISYKYEYATRAQIAAESVRVVEGDVGWSTSYCGLFVTMSSSHEHVTLEQQHESLAGLGDRMTHTDTQGERERERETDRPILSLRDGRLPDLRIYQTRSPLRQPHIN